jgi:hypothetical protein
VKQRAYRIRWLGAEHAELISAVEREAHPPEHQAGTHLIWAQLAEKDEHGGNLSLGLFLGRRLVGYLLVFVMRNRREVAEFFDVPVAPGVDPDESVLYASDFAVLEEHRRMAGLLAQKFGEVVSSRSDLRGLSLDAFGTDSYAQIWTGRKGFFKRFGWQLVETLSFEDPKLQSRLHWLHFKRTQGPRDEKAWRGVAERPRRRVSTRVIGIESLREWRHVREAWNELLLSSRERSVLQTYDYLSCWYKHIGITDPLRIRVQVRGEALQAVALLRRIKYSLSGLRRVQLTNLQGAADGFSSPLITEANPDLSVQMLVADLLSDEGDWDSLRFAGLSSDDLRVLRPLVEEREDYWVSIDASPPVSTIEVRGHYPQLAQARERGHALKLGTTESTALDLERFVAIERVDEDSMASSAIGASSARLSMHRELAQRHALGLGMNCAFLEGDGKTPAALLGYEWQRQFLVTHVALPEGEQHQRLLWQMLAGLQATLAERGSSDAIVCRLPGDIAKPGIQQERHSLCLRRHTAIGTLTHAAAGLRRALNSMRTSR